MSEGGYSKPTKSTGHARYYQEMALSPETREVVGHDSPNANQILVAKLLLERRRQVGSTSSTVLEEIANWKEKS